MFLDQNKTLIYVPFCLGWVCKPKSAAVTHPVAAFNYPDRNHVML